MNNKFFKLRVGSYNLRNITDLYCYRMKMFPEIINKINVDVIALQEVSFIEYNQIDDLFTKDNLTKFSQFKAKSQLDYAKVNELKDPSFRIDGNAICIKKSIEVQSHILNHEVLHLSPVRNCHCLSFTLNGIRIHFVNVHLHHLENEEIIRVHQMKQALKWIESISDHEDLIIIAGDFNALPNSDTYNLMINSGYVSSHYNKYGKEPEKTFHNKMDCDTKDDYDEGTFDYIFFKNHSKKYMVGVENVEIFGTEESKEKRSIFASDHLAIVTELNITVNE